MCVWCQLGQPHAAGDRSALAFPTPETSPVGVSWWLLGRPNGLEAVGTKNDSAREQGAREADEKVKSAEIFLSTNQIGSSFQRGGIKKTDVKTYRRHRLHFATCNLRGSSIAHRYVLISPSCPSVPQFRRRSREGHRLKIRLLLRTAVYAGYYVVELFSHYCNSHNQVRGHRTGASDSGAKEYPREKHKPKVGGTRILYYKSKNTLQL